MLRRIQKKKGKKVVDVPKRVASVDNATPNRLTPAESQVPSQPNCLQHSHGGNEFVQENPHANNQTDSHGFVADHDITSSRGVETSMNGDATPSTPRKTRGPTRLTDIWNRLPGQELPEQFNVYNQCVDDGELSKFCGTIARDPKLTPLEYDDWRLVPTSIKEDIWRIVKSKFNLQPRRKTWVLREVGKLLRVFKATLYVDNFFKYKTLADLKANKDPRTRQDQWEALASRWYSEKWQKKSEHGKKAIKELKMVQTSGTISFARHAEEELKRTGKRPNRAKLYLHWHKHRDGRPVSNEAAVAFEKIEHLMTAQAVNTEGEPSTRLDDFAPIEGDVLSQVLGPEKNGSVRGLGFGVSPNMFKKSYADIVRENEQLRQEKLEVEGKYAMVMEKVDMLTELVKKCIDNSTLGQASNVVNMHG